MGIKPIPAIRWSHVGVTFGNGKLHIYVNGYKESSHLVEADRQVSNFEKVALK
jgi:hypothetical protein